MVYVIFIIILDCSFSEENENQKWGEKWNFLMSYIRKVYRMVMDGEEVECYPHPFELKEIAYE